MFVVTVDIAVKPESRVAFLEAMHINAHASIRNEIGCHQFDVCVPASQISDEPRVFLYELYVDRAAFDAHLRTEHFIEFDRKTAPWIESKTVKTWTLLP